ncbi:glycosyltransferase family 4 protein [Conexibacter stalactiti]|uniref:Glycosyltransferase family 4 protein n=1 Tax=Conexibacter stalactiti TaxID=1940611 RepID=A0ABU4HTN1_9ACTN|nr:glycosyltransferase family 4 protein [Conexibacter stalactiti]MDW5596663.1 glycosyltransferase family 4 protein [Conexibacter stalactiti]MEC5037305.1 glycosyltransferase family 4 protein [Conexibacter stalactiti]
MAATRVLILSWEYPPLIEGGLARHVRKLSEQLVARGVEVHVLTRGDARGLAEQEMDGVFVHRVSEPRKPADLDEFVSWIEQMNGDMVAAGLELGARMTFDLVHGHDWLVAQAGDELSRRLRTPWVVTIHATEYGRHQGWVDKHPQSHIHGVETWMANKADAVITCSHYMRDHVSDIYGLDDQRVAVIPNGIDPLDLQPVEDLDALRGRFAQPHERLVLLVGRLVYEKGFQIALEALPGVIERLGDVRFLVAGSGTAETELREQADKLGLLEHGTFLGWIGDDVLHSLYRIADLTVVPSIYEPFGLVALEAMASGCPTIVADTGGLREVVPNENVGLRFRSRDPGSLAAMMERVLSDEPLREQLIAEASEHVLSFDWADIARQTAEVYGELRRGLAV